MKKKVVFKWICIILLAVYSVIATFAQTASADLDSITEDSYQRMLNRQAAERESDSLQTMLLDSEVAVQERRKPECTYYLIGVFLLVGVLLVYAYIRSTSKSKHNIKK